MSCKINDDIEVKVYKNEHNLVEVICFSLDGDTLYVHVAGKVICNIIRTNLSSKQGINCTTDMKIKNLTIKLVSHNDNMTYRYYMQQPRPMIETKMVKHIKYMSEDEKFFNYDLISYKHDLSLL